MTEKPLFVTEHTEKLEIYQKNDSIYCKKIAAEKNEVEKEEELSIADRKYVVIQGSIIDHFTIKEIGKVRNEVRNKVQNKTTTSIIIIRCCKINTLEICNCRFDQPVIIEHVMVESLKIKHSVFTSELKIVKLLKGNVLLEEIKFNNWIKIEKCEGTELLLKDLWKSASGKGAPRLRIKDSSYEKIDMSLLWMLRNGEIFVINTKVTDTFKLHDIPAPIEQGNLILLNLDLSECKSIEFSDLYIEHASLSGIKWGDITLERILPDTLEKDPEKARSMYSQIKRALIDQSKDIVTARRFLRLELKAHQKQILASLPEFLRLPDKIAMALVSFSILLFLIGMYLLPGILLVQPLYSLLAVATVLLILILSPTAKNLAFNFAELMLYQLYGLISDFGTSWLRPLFVFLSSIGLIYIITENSRVFTCNPVTLEQIHEAIQASNNFYFFVLNLLPANLSKDY